MIIVLAASLQAQWSNDPNNNLIVGYGLDPHICSDNAGGCYVTYDYENIYYPRKLALERLDKYGYKPWGTLKQIIGESPEQSGAQIVEDGEGGVIVSYKDRLENLPSWTQRIRVQRVDSSGNFLWGQAGIKVTLDEINQSLQQVVADGSGGCVVTWKTISYTFYANRISANGERLWSDSGILLGISNYSGTEPKIIRAADGCFYVETGEYIYRIRENGEIIRRDSVILGNIVPDPKGGIVLSGKVGSINNRRLAAQRKDSLGNSLWAEPYIEIADSLYINAIISVKEINGYYYYSWHGKKNGIDLVAQYQALRSDGTKLFNQGSMPISNYPVDALLGEIIPSDSGTFVLIWQDYRSEDGVFGQRRDTLNNPFWNVNDIPLYTGAYSELHSVTDCAGGAIGLGWHQFDFSIRAFKVSKYGILGEVITGTDDPNELIIPDEIILYQNYPNPFNSSTIIKYQIPKVETHRDESLQLVKLIVYDVLGNEVTALVNEEKPAGKYEIEFTATGLSSGIYFYKLEAGNPATGSGQSFIQTKKMILLK